MSYLQCLSYNCVEQLCAYGVKKKGNYETDPDSLSNCPGRLPFFSNLCKEGLPGWKSIILGLEFSDVSLKVTFQ